MARRKKDDIENFKVRVKKEKVLVEEVVIPSFDRFHISHSKATELWNRVLSDQVHCGIGEFLSTMGFYIPITLEDYVGAGGFLMNLEKLFPEEKVQSSLFFWLKETMSPVLTLWGITSITALEWSRNAEERKGFFKFICAWGYSLLKHPESKGKVPEYVESRMKEVGLELW